MGMVILGIDVGSVGPVLGGDVERYGALCTRYEFSWATDGEGWARRETMLTLRRGAVTRIVSLSP